MKPKQNAQSKAPTPGPWTMNAWRVEESMDYSKTRIYFADGRVEHFRNQVFAYALWLALPKGIRMAFRGPNDRRPVYPWDCVDRP